MQISVNPQKEREPIVVLGSSIVYKQRAEWFDAHWRPLELSLLRGRRHFSYDKDTGKLPLIVFVPGGGFSHTERNVLVPELVWFAKHGYAVASVDYSATPKTRFPMQIEDIRQAIRFLRANEEAFGIDGSRVAILGESSGGYLAAFTALTGKDPVYDKGEYLSYSGEVQAAVAMYPVVTPRTMYDEIQKPIPMPDIPSYPDLTALAKRDAPPMLLMCGEKDACCPFGQSVKLHDALEAAGADVTLARFLNTNHADLPLFQDSAKQLILDFLRKKLETSGTE